LSTQSLELLIDGKTKQRPKTNEQSVPKFAEDRRGSLPANLDSISPPEIRQRRTSIVLQESPSVTTVSKSETVPYLSSPKNRIKKMYELYEATSERGKDSIGRTSSFTHKQIRPRAATAGKRDRKYL
jgi:hypothetical protein